MGNPTSTARRLAMGGLGGIVRGGIPAQNPENDPCSLALSLSRSLALSLGSFGLLAASSPAQAPQIDIDDRVIADLGPTGLDINEPSLAVARLRRLGACQTLSAGGPMRFATQTPDSASWTADAILPLGGGFLGGDPTMTLVDGQAQSFVLLALRSALGAAPLKYTTWTPAGGFSAWTTAYTPVPCTPALLVSQDKPWALRRESNDFLMFFYRGPCGFSYLRTPDGLDWGDPSDPLPVFTVQTQAPEVPVLASFCCHPARAQDGRVFLAHATGIYGQGGRVRVLAGVDPEGDNAGELAFTYLKSAGGAPIEFSPRFSQAAQSLPVPTPSGSMLARTVPTIACDPSDPDWAYIVYHDVAEDDPSDMNVYLARLHRTGSAWDVTIQVVHDDVLVQDDTHAPARADQFTPVIAVDSRGWIHLLYYDNRKMFDSSEYPYSVYHYDAWYALSTDHGATFDRHDLRSSADAIPALNLGFQGSQVTLEWSPREYNGIGIYDSADQARVFLLYSGTAKDEADDPFHRSVLYGQQVHVTPGG